MLALHKECLTLRYLLGRLDFLEGLLGFTLGIGRALEGAELLAELLELLLYLSHLSILLLSLGALRSRLGFGCGQRFLQGRHFGCGSYRKP